MGHRAEPLGPPALSAPPASLGAFLAPRYWGTWAFLLWLRLTAALPWRWAIKLHKGLGRVLGALLPRRRRIVRRNLEICFPELPEREVDQLLWGHFECVGAMLAEIANSWFGSHERRAHLFHIEGLEHLNAALAKGKGVILFSGHFTPLEICVPQLKQLVPLFAFMFRARNNPLLNVFQSRSRVRAAHESVGNDNVRTMLRLLRRNAVVWYAPDQAPAQGGELLPFFGEPALTSTAASRIAKVSGATILPLFYARRRDDTGYVMRFHAPLANLPSDDATADTQRLTTVLEGFVRESCEQYFWTHRKFKSRPAKLQDAYGNGASG